MPESLRVHARTEYLLLALVILLKPFLLYTQWGILQGFDASQYIITMRNFEFGETIPSIYKCFNCYHPPLSFLSANTINLTGIKEIPSSQLLSWISIGLAFLALRATLKHIGLLRTHIGVLFLYLTCALPVFIFLSTASTYESLSYLFSILTLYLGILLYWNPEAGRLTNRRIFLLCLLLITLIGGLETKYTGVVNLGIPFIIVAIRYKGNMRLRCFSKLILLSLIAAIFVSPLYIGRNYTQSKELFPVNMNWRLKDELVVVRAERDSDIIGFMAHAFRIPKGFFSISDDSIKNSFVHTVWFQTWKIEGSQLRKFNLDSHGASMISSLYYFLFILPFIAGSTLFVIRARKRNDALHDFGKVLLGIVCIFVLAQTSFFYKFPMWKYGIMKAKYIAPALLWIVFASAYCVHVALQLKCLQKFRPFITYGSLGLVLLYVVLNHVVPVY